MMLFLILASTMALRYELNKVPRVSMDMNVTGFKGSLPLYNSDAYNFVYLLNATVGTPPQKS